MTHRLFLIVFAIFSLTQLQLVAGSATELLLSKDSDIRKKAMIDLARSKDIERCHELLKSPEFLLRKAAVFALARLNTESETLKQKEAARNALKKVLKDSSSIIQFEAAHTLARWGINEGEKILVEVLLHTNTLRRRRAAEALYHIGSSEAIKNLIYNLRDADGTVRRASVTTLQKITGQNFGYNPIDPRYLPLEDDERRDLLNRRREAVDSLQFEDDQDEQSSLQKRQVANQISEEFKTAIDNRTIEMSKSRDEIIMTWKTWWLENKEGNRIDWLTSGLNHENPLTRLSSISSLGDIKATEALNDVIESLQDDNTDVVSAACRALTQLKQKEAIPALIDLLKNTQGANKTEESKLIRNYAAYQALLNLTQANFSSLSAVWESWWENSEDFYSIDHDLPHGQFNVKLLSTSGSSATFEVKFFHKAQKTWFTNEFTVSNGEEIGQSGQEHVFNIQGRTYSRKFDMRTKLMLSDLSETHVTLKPKGSDVTSFTIALP